ncbi:MAG: hypothetical protein QNJ55_00730 [Xenococcus sp. MO_188.B8]|nr:hypothetical protein [Xenococcus sp. MO_188.B8]
MPNKRSKRKVVKRFYCPFCEQRLWRTGTSKYYLYYSGVGEIKENTNLSSKKAKLLANTRTTYIDNNKWIEGFFCSEHGALWLLVSVQEKVYEYKLAKQKDWLKTGKTLDPENFNPSVSEFTRRMSRKPQYK